MRLTYPRRNPEEGEYRLVALDRLRTATGRLDYGLGMDSGDPIRAADKRASAVRRKYWLAFRMHGTNGSALVRSGRDGSAVVSKVVGVGMRPVMLVYPGSVVASSWRMIF
jgi:hypothetical protein